MIELEFCEFSGMNFTSAMSGMTFETGWTGFKLGWWVQVVLSLDDEPGWWFQIVLGLDNELDW